MRHLFLRVLHAAEHFLTCSALVDYLTEHETNMDVRDRAVFYYRCLRNDIEKVFFIYVITLKLIIFQAKCKNFRVSDLWPCIILLFCSYQGRISFHKEIELLI